MGLSALASAQPSASLGTSMATYNGYMSEESVPPPARAIGVRTIGAREFRDNCLQVLRDVNETREEVVVTRHKVPIARISPPELEPSVPIFGRYARELKILGDITEPVFDPGEFDMEARPERVLDPEGYDRRGSR